MNSGQIIRRLRKASDLTHKQLGEKIGVGGSTISSYENGGSQPPLEKLELLANVFNVKVAVFTSAGIGEEDTEEVSYYKSLVFSLQEEKSKILAMLDKALTLANSSGNFPKGSIMLTSLEAEAKPEYTTLKVA